MDLFVEKIKKKKVKKCIKRKNHRHMRFGRSIIFTSRFCFYYYHFHGFGSFEH